METKQYLISQDLIDCSDSAGVGGSAKPNRKGYIRLYNKNAWKTTYWKIVKQSENSRTWIVERKSGVPQYWSKVIKQQVTI